MLFILFYRRGLHGFSTSRCTILKIKLLSLLMVPVKPQSGLPHATSMAAPIFCQRSQGDSAYALEKANKWQCIKHCDLFIRLFYTPISADLHEGLAQPLHGRASTHPARLDAVSPAYGHGRPR